MPAAPKFLLTILLGTILLPVPVWAEKADREKPVHLEADKVTLDDIQKISVFEGNVLLIQGTLMLQADRLEAKQNGDGLQSVVAKGNPVSFRQKREGVEEYIEGFANQVEYDNVKSLLRLTGEARLRRDSDEIRGSQITYDANTELYKVVGQQGATGASGRVRVIIRPKPKGSQEKNTTLPNP